MSKFAAWFLAISFLPIWIIGWLIGALMEGFKVGYEKGGDSIYAMREIMQDIKTREGLEMIRRLQCWLAGHRRMRKITPLSVISAPVDYEIVCDYVCSRCGYTESRKVKPRKVKAKEAK